MKILVLNCGSSSIKYKLYDMTDHSVMAQGGIEKIGLPGSFLKMTLPDGTKKIIEEDIPEHTKGVQFIFHILTDPELGALKSLEELGAVGHRMVHGGEKFNQSVLLTPEVLEAFTACNDLAPLHNPANLKGVNAVSALLPSIPQVGVFDTAFHQTMPDYAYMYALPYEYYEKDKVRRYGFHGTSHKYVSQRAAAMLGKKPEELKLISCHLGNGSSVTAVDGGKSVDTSMGFTPRSEEPTSELQAGCHDVHDIPADGSHFRHPDPHDDEYPPPHFQDVPYRYADRRRQQFFLYRTHHGNRGQDQRRHRYLLCHGLRRQ